LLQRRILLIFIGGVFWDFHEYDKLSTEFWFVLLTEQSHRLIGEIMLRFLYDGKEVLLSQVYRSGWVLIKI